MEGGVKEFYIGKFGFWCLRKLPAVDGGRGGWVFVFRVVWPASCMSFREGVFEIWSQPFEA